jgi:hypothetical protein
VEGLFFRKAKDYGPIVEYSLRKRERGWPWQLLSSFQKKKKRERERERERDWKLLLLGYRMFSNLVLRGSSYWYCFLHVLLQNLLIYKLCLIVYWSICWLLEVWEDTTSYTCVYRGEIKIDARQRPDTSCSLKNKYNTIIYIFFYSNILFIWIGHSLLIIFYFIYACIVIF